MPDIFPFISYVLIATFTPGPNNIMAMTKAGNHGFKRSLAFNIGVFSGFFIIMVLSSLFSSALLAYIPKVKPYISYVGALYILWLAYKVFTSGYKGENSSETGKKNYVQGVLMQFANPKAILFGLTVVSSFIVPYYDSVVVLLVFSIILAAVALIATSCWSLFGSVFNKLMTRHYKLLNTIMALLLVYTAVSLIF